MQATLELCPPPEGRKRWRRAECDYLENAGLLTERYELLDGEIVSKKGQNSPHAITVMRVIAYLLGFFATNNIRTQATIKVCEEDRITNRPEPDITVLRDAVYRLPMGEDVLLAVEVSDRTQYDDFGHKVRLYARAGMAEYRVLDLARRLLVVFRDPRGDDWQTRVKYAEADMVASLTAPEAKVALSELLPLLETRDSTS